MSADRFMKTIGRNLAAFRKHQSLRQTEAANQSGLSYRYYQTIESGKANLTLSTLYKLSQLYRVHPCDLMDEGGTAGNQVRTPL